MRENKDQKNSKYRHFSRAHKCLKTNRSKLDFKGHLRKRKVTDPAWIPIGTKYSRMDQVKLWNTAFKKVYTDHTLSYFLKAVFHKFYLVQYWTLCPNYCSKYLSRYSLCQISIEFNQIIFSKIKLHI